MKTYTTLTLVKTIIVLLYFKKMVERDNHILYCLPITPTY